MIWWKCFIKGKFHFCTSLSLLYNTRKKFAEGLHGGRAKVLMDLTVLC